jgi:very-short-patch-repair endonuclease
MKRLALKAGTVEQLRYLRRNATDAELALKRKLREHFPDAKFRFQVPFGPYRADFASHRAKPIIELDGGQHATAREYDEARTAFLNGEGFQVIRFWNNDVLKNMDGVLTRINQTLAPCGRGWCEAPGEGPAAFAAEKTPSPEYAFSGSQTRAAPHPIPLPQGERGSLSNL